MTTLNAKQQKILDDIRTESADYAMMLDTNPLFDAYTEEARLREAAEIVLQTAVESSVRHFRGDRPEQARNLLHAAAKTADMLHERPEPDKPESSR